MGVVAHAGPWSAHSLQRHAALIMQHYGIVFVILFNSMPHSSLWHCIYHSRQSLNHGPAVTCFARRLLLADSSKPLIPVALAGPRSDH
eukprot:1147280-Pelagomonas_calceolata.AAC.11